MTLPLDHLIFIGTIPLIKIYVTIFFGFVLAKMDLFPAAASRGASQVAMNISLPCLIFANVVPAFKPSNASVIGTLMLLAFIYQAIGFVLGIVIREFMYVPRNFWQGIVVLCLISNWGNLPNAVVLSVTGQEPFHAPNDTAMGVACVAIFVACQHITFWALGTARSLSWDYLPGVPQKEAAERHVPWSSKPIGGWFYRVVLRRQVEDVWNTPNNDTATLTAGVDVEKVLQSPRTLVNFQRGHSEESTKTASFSPSSDAASVPTEPSHDEAQPVSPEQPKSPLKTFLLRISTPFRAVANPITITLIVALIVAVVLPLKALFVDCTADGGPHWHGPDGRPPLSFIIDTASFLGGIIVPLALILLGVSFARLNIPRPLSRLPWAAMLSVAAVKMVIIPICGIFIVQAMTRNGMIRPQAKAQKFVAVLLSGTPASVNQLVVTTLYSGDGEVDTLSAFLLVQYILMFFASAVLCIIALYML